MKNITEFINEQLILEAFHIFKLNTSNAQAGVKLEDSLRDFLIHTKNRYSLTNKQDLEKLFKDFSSQRFVDNDSLKQFGLTSGKAIASILIDNKEKLEELGWKFDCIKTFDETELQKEYKEWKQSKDYVEGKQLDKKAAEDNDDEEVLQRTLVIYNADYPGNPETTLEYDFFGKRGKATDHQVNMIRMDYHYKTGVNYYKANACLLSYYLGKSEDELKERDLTDDSDLMVGK